MHNTAIVLAAGSGSRMKSRVKKQYRMLGGYPTLYYALKAFQEHSKIQEIILVCGEEEMAYCREQMVERYAFTKVTRIVPGGKERYHSVHAGLKAAEDCGYVLIHDGARPFVDAAMIDRIFSELEHCQACVAGMPVKDTIKLSREDGYVESTPPRERLWMVQTPQAFSYALIRNAYDQLEEDPPQGVKITDDAMVAEFFAHVPVKLVEGSYENIKITTPEDLLLAEAILGRRELG